MILKYMGSIGTSSEQKKGYECILMLLCYGSVAIYNPESLYTSPVGSPSVYGRQNHVVAVGYVSCSLFPRCFGIAPEACQYFAVYG